MKPDPEGRQNPIPSTPLGEPGRAARAPRRKRLALLIIVGVIVIGFTIVYRYFRYARPVGEGPAGPIVSRDAFSSTWSDRPVVLLGLGDSVTQGLGASPAKSYFVRLAKNPTDEFSDMQGIALSKVLPGLKPLNLSISGTTSIECVDYQLPKLQPYSSDTFGIVVMTTGGNDVIHNYGRTPAREGAMYGAKFGEIDQWVRNFDQRLDLIAARIRETFPGGCHIFIANIYDPTDNDGDIQLAGLPPWPDGVKVLAAYSQTIEQFAKRHDDVSLIDIHTAFLGHGVHCTHFWHRDYCRTDPHYWYWDNLEDPNDRGYDAIRRLFLIEMAKVLPPILIK
jgi:lysophospholipase L1-like esterase